MNKDLGLNTTKNTAEEQNVLNCFFRVINDTKLSIDQKMTLINNRLKGLNLEDLAVSFNSLKTLNLKPTDLFPFMLPDAFKFEFYQRTFILYQQMWAYAMLGFYDQAKECKQRFEEMEIKSFELFGSVPKYHLNWSDEGPFMQALPEKEYRTGIQDRMQA
jgi:hypothetical protein